MVCVFKCASTKKDLVYLVALSGYAALRTFVLIQLLIDVSVRTMVLVRMKGMCIQLLLLDIHYNSPLHLASAPVVLKVPDCATRRQERLQPMA